MSSNRIPRLTLVLAIGVATTSAFAGAEEAAERAAKSLAGIQIRTLKKAVDVCSIHEAADSKTIGRLFDQYMSAFHAGTKSGLLEMYRTEIEHDQMEYSDPKAIEMQLRQGEQTAQVMRDSPLTCKKLEAHLAAGSAAAFKQVVIDGYREYIEKRRAVCAQSPRPKSCDGNGAPRK